MTPHEGVLREEYDDMLPVSLYKALKPPRYHLLDRHNDRIAVFDEARDDAECQRIVDAVNAHELKSRLADAQARVTKLEEENRSASLQFSRCELIFERVGIPHQGDTELSLRQFFKKYQELAQQHAALRERCQVMQDALQAIQEYDNGNGCCYYGCDTPTIAKQALATGEEGL